jgi:hypothetical protein
MLFVAMIGRYFDTALGDRRSHSLNTSCASRAMARTQLIACHALAEPHFGITSSILPSRIFIIAIAHYSTASMFCTARILLQSRSRLPLILTVDIIVRHAIIDINTARHFPRRIDLI